MDLSDFSKGIITDVDPQDGAGIPDALTECINFDIYPGQLVKRDGTKRRQWDVGTYNFSTRVLTVTGTAGAGTGIPLADEELVQVVSVYAPDARTTSVKDFPAGSEHCLNREVTVILMRVHGANTYRVYADYITAGTFVKIATSGATAANWLVTGEANEVPFMIPRQGAVAIGNVFLFNSDGSVSTEKGVLWCGHIKKLMGLTKGTDEGANLVHATWMNAVDEWRISNSECYDSGGEIYVDAVVSSFEDIYAQALSTSSVLYRIGDAQSPKVSVRKLLKDYFTPFLLGAGKRKFKLFATAMYDGYQESRPLKWKSATGPYVTSDIIRTDATSGDVTWGAGFNPDDTERLPLAWTIKADEKYQQYLKVEIDEIIPRTNAPAWIIYPYPNAGEAIPQASADKLACVWDMVWNNPWREDTNTEDMGDGFNVKIAIRGPETPTDWGEDMDAGLTCEYHWEFDGVSRTGLELVLHIKRERRFDTMPFILWALGYDAPFQEGETRGPSDKDYQTWLGWQRFKGPIRENRDICRKFWTISNVIYTAEPATGLSPAPFEAVGGYNKMTGPPTDILVVANRQIVTGEFVDFTTGRAATGDGALFQLLERTGLGLLHLRPHIPYKAVMEAAGSTDTVMEHGCRRLTGFRFYLQEDETDVDARMIRQVNLDYAEHSTDHGGIGPTIGTPVISWRDMYDVAPTWMANGTTDVIPYAVMPGPPGAEFGYERAGINRVFLISDSDMKDASGKSLLSANLLRDFTETDKPQWKRGAMCDGRLFGISMKNGDMQYSIVAGGVAQYDIMPGTFHVAKGETLTHIVSWRGQHHMIFTDQNLWRIDLAGGDEFDWRVMDTFLKQGTPWWQGIVDTPHGVFYPNANGLWVYDGSEPTDIVRGRWQKTYIPLSRSATAANTFGGYDATKGDVHFVLPTINAVWIFDITARTWRKYEYEPNITPSYMTTFKGEWIMAFAQADVRTRDFTTKQDASATPFGVCAITQELPGPDQTSTPYWQYLGVRYKTASALSPAAKVTLLTSAYDDLRHPSTKIACSTTRHEYFFPLPFGFGRGTRIRFAQGEANADANHAGDITLSSFSLRGVDIEQWRGTR